MTDDTKLSRRKFLAGAAVGTASAMHITIPATAFAQAGYPRRPITLVVMYLSLIHI